MKPNLVILLALIFSAFCGCSDDKLTRDKAAKLIKETYKYPGDELDAFCVQGYWRDGAFSELQTEGILTYTLYRRESPSNCYSAQLTEKGKQYAKSDRYQKQGSDDLYITVKKAELDFGEITGIVENKQNNSAVVNYTWIRKNQTPFALKKFGPPTIDGTFPASATFIKYDDGWRITTPAPTSGSIINGMFK